MRTQHRMVYKNSSRMKELPPGSVDLVVTSPPYPMIEMWDGVFSRQNRKIADALRSLQGSLAFELMHRQLDPVWNEVYRVLKAGGIACINIGDATRTLDDHFALYTNHARILNYMQGLGFSALPAVLWRKQTNAPNKFMGSGMMPPGAYVTLEHEYVLVLRKGNKKEFKDEHDQQLRRESAFFWEERNAWFSDVWMDLKGASQNLFDDKVRKRSAAFPIELPYRLISMFSVKGDTVLDPFLGIGTSMMAAMAAGRNSVGYEIDTNFGDIVSSHLQEVVGFAHYRIHQRLEHHLSFVAERIKNIGKFKYLNKHYHFPVMTRQETDLLLNELLSVDKIAGKRFEATYSDDPQAEFVGSWDHHVLTADEIASAKAKSKSKGKEGDKQRKLFA